MVSESSCHCHKFNELSNEGTFDDEMVRGDVNDVVEDVVVEVAVIVVVVEVVDVNVVVISLSDEVEPSVPSSNGISVDDSSLFL